MQTHQSLGSQSQNQGELRRVPRVNILTGLGEVVVVNLGSGTGLLLDVSNGGVAVQAVYPILQEANIDIAFPLPFTANWIDGVCKVAWVDEGGRAGLQFLHVADKPRRRLDRWLAKYPEKANALAGAGSETEPVAESMNAGSRQAADAAASGNAAAAIAAAGVEQIGSGGAASDVLAQAVGRACRLTGADGAAVVLCEPGGVICRASTGEAPDVGSRLQPHSGFTAECVRTGNVVFSSDAENDPRGHPVTVRRLRLRSLLIVPIRAGGAVMGAVEVLSCRPSFFEVAQATTLRPIAEMIASALVPPVETKAEEQPRKTRRVARGALAQLTKLLNQGIVVARSRMAPYVAAACLLLAIGGVVILGRSGRRTSVATSAYRAELLDTQAAATPDRSSKRSADVPPSRKPRRLGQEEGTHYQAAERLQVAIASKSIANDRAPVEAPSRAVPQSVFASPSRNSASEKTPQPANNALIPVQSIGKHQARNETATRSSLDPLIAPLGLGNFPRQNNLLASLFLTTPPSLPRLSAPSRRLGTSEVIIGHAISQPLPSYPERARRLGVQGSVFVRSVIDVDGRIKQVAVLEGDPVLAQPVTDAVKQWRYAPTYLDRIPIEMEEIDELKFSAMGNAPQVSTPLHLPEGIKRGRPISQPLPQYPEAALRLGVQGSVVLRGVIAVDGRMKELRRVAGNPLLAQSAFQTVSSWRYEPSYLNGMPVEVDTTVVVNFRGH